MIEFRNVKLNIKNVDVINDLNFKIEDNTSICFVGNKSAGKSLILKLLAGIYDNYSGEILIDNDYIENNKKQNISLVHDEREKNVDLNVYDYLMFYGDLLNVKSNLLKERIENMMFKFHISLYKHMDVNDLDDDTYKIVSIIKAMINNPDVIMFDNLFSSLNPDFNDKIVDILKSLVGKKTMIFANRNMKHLENICNYIGVMDTGELLAYGKTEDIFEKAELHKKIEMEVLYDNEKAINVLSKNRLVSNIIYDGNKISFSIKGDTEDESKILNELIVNDVKIYSYVKEKITFEQLFARLKR